MWEYRETSGGCKSLYLRQSLSEPAIAVTPLGNAECGFNLQLDVLDHNNKRIEGTDAFVLDHETAQKLIAFLQEHSP